MPRDLICRRSDSFGEWYVVAEAANQYGWFTAGGAIVEGDAADFTGLAVAIETRSRHIAKRCSAICVTDMAGVMSVLLSSPRNSVSEALVPIEVADGLAKSIREVLSDEAEP